MLREYRGEAFWQSAWPLPAIYAVYLMYCMPKDSAIVLMNRVMIIAVLAVSISLFGIFLLLYEMYRVAKEFTRSSQLDRENQLLGMEARRYTELRTYMENTRRLRHDFRQHLHVIAGLTEAGQLEELKSYLHQYESELSEQRSALCANAAVDALAGHYDNEAKQQATPIEWKLELPRQLPLPEADLCTVLGNLLENALRQPAAAARAAAGAGDGPDAEPRHAGHCGGEQLRRCAEKAERHFALHQARGRGRRTGVHRDGSAQIQRQPEHRDPEPCVPGECAAEPVR